MPLRVPVSANAAEEIRSLALRFSKELQSLTDDRIREDQLQDAFVKPLGYKSFNEVICLCNGTHARFPLKEYLASLYSELRNHLPTLVSDVNIEAALNIAVNPGYVSLTIDGREAPMENLQLLTRSNFFREFRRKIFLEGRSRHLAYSELLNSFNHYSSESRHGSIIVTLDYSKWPNENDPLFEWEAFDSFIRMVHGNAVSANSVDIDILRIDRNSKMDIFEGFDRTGIAKWKPRIMIIDIGPGHMRLADIIKIVSDKRAMNQKDV